MSRLDSFIRRMCAQRDCLNHAFDLIDGLPGPVLEIGLGNGRTFDHLRAGCPDRDIFVFEKKISPHPDCVPEPEFLFEGDIHETMPGALERIGRPAVLAHNDVGSGVVEFNRMIADFLKDALPPLMADRALVLSDQEMELSGWQSVPLPDGVPAERYFFYGRGL